MRARALHTSDVEACVDLARRMHEESDYRVHPFSEGKVERLLAKFLSMDVLFGTVCEDEAEIVGFMGGMVGEHYFSPVLYATDIALYVVPERRGSTAALRMMSLFHAWAAEQGATEIRCGVTTGINPATAERFYTRLGYEPSGTLYVKRLGALSTGH